MELFSLLQPGTVIGAVGHYGTTNAWRKLREANIQRIVNRSNREPRGGWLSLLPDDLEIGRMAARYLLKKGHRNFMVREATDLLFSQRK